MSEVGVVDVVINEPIDHTNEYVDNVPFSSVVLVCILQ